MMLHYQGFGFTLVEAAGLNDIDLLLGCSLVSVFVVLFTQLVSDVGYATSTRASACSEPHAMQIEYIGVFQIILGVITRFWPVWVALAIVLIASSTYKSASASTASCSTAASAWPVW